MDSINIRPADELDAAGLAQVQVNSYLTAYASIFPSSYLDQFTFEEQAQDWHDLIASASSDKVLVAAREDRGVVGYALVRLQPGPPGTPLAPFTGELAALRVRKQDQGHGIGRRLIAAASAWLCDQGRLSMYLTVLQRNELARRLYVNLGGQFLGEVKRFDVDGWEIVEVAYAWSNIFNLIHQPPVNLNQITIQPMQPQQAQAALNVVLGVAYDIFNWSGSLDETANRFAEAGELQDIRDFSSHYNGRGGLFLVALNADQRVVGTCAVRPWSDQVCELKRMWLLKPYHGHGIGLRLLEGAVDHARSVMGCKTMLLNTDSESLRAIQFYHRFGFRDIPRYTDEGGEIAMRLEL